VSPLYFNGFDLGRMIYISASVSRWKIGAAFLVLIFFVVIPTNCVCIKSCRNAFLSGLFLRSKYNIHQRVAPFGLDVSLTILEEALGSKSHDLFLDRLAD
jgi:hypothetical protein